MRDEGVRVKRLHTLIKKPITAGCSVVGSALPTEIHLYGCSCSQMGLRSNRLPLRSPLRWCIVKVMLVDVCDHAALPISPRIDASRFGRDVERSRATVVKRVAR